MLLTRLMNAPARLQQGIAVFVALCALVVTFALASQATLALRGQALQITELRQHAGKLAGLAAMKDDALKLAGQAPSQSASDVLTEAQNLPIAKANLQSRIGAIAVTNGVAVASSGGVPDIEESGLLLIGLRADVSGTNEAIAGFLAQIESARPPLLVREFTLRSDGAPLPDLPPTLTASIKLYAALRAPMRETPAANAAAAEQGGQLQ